MNARSFFALAPCLSLLLTLSPAPLDAQEFLYTVTLLNLDDQSGPLNAGLIVGQNSTGTPYTPFGEIRRSHDIYTDTYESATGDIEDSTGREHSRFSASAFANYVIALPNRRNVAVNSQFHNLGMFNLTSTTRKMTLAELNGPSLTTSVSPFSAAQYPKDWRPQNFAGFTPGDGTWWVVRRLKTHSAFDLFLHKIADTLVVGVEGDALGTFGTKVDHSIDSAMIRLVNTSRQSSLSLEVVDSRIDTVAPFVASGGKVIPFGEKQVIVRRGDEILFDTTMIVRPYGFYDLVVLQADSENPGIRIDERLVDRVAARIFPDRAQPDGTTPYWKVDVRVVKQQTGMHAETRVVFLDSTLGEIKTALWSLRYLDVYDEFRSRLARYQLPGPTPFQKTYLVTEAEGEVALYWYDEFAPDDRSLSELETLPLSTLSLSAGVWNFVKRSDSLTLHLPALQMRDTVGSMVAHFLGREIVPRGTDFILRSSAGGWERTGLLDGPGGGNTFILADDDPAGGIRTVVLGTDHGRAPGALGFVNFTEGLGPLYLYRSSIGTGRVTDSIPEGQSLVLDINTDEKDTVVVTVSAGDTLGTYSRNARDQSWYFVYDGHRDDGVIRRYSIHDQTFGSLRGTDFDLRGISGVARSGERTTFSLRPIPGADRITMELTDAGRESEYLLTVVDLLGRVVLQRTLVPSHSTEGSISVDCSALPVGTYYFHFSSQEGSLGTRIVPIVRQ